MAPRQAPGVERLWAKQVHCHRLVYTPGSAYAGSETLGVNIAGTSPLSGSIIVSVDKVIDAAAARTQLLTGVTSMDFLTNAAILALDAVFAQYGQ